MHAYYILTNALLKQKAQPLSIDGIEKHSCWMIPANNQKKIGTLPDGKIHQFANVP